MFTASASEKGDTLEAFVAYAFGCYPRLFVDEGKRRGVFERDRVITVRAAPGTLPASWRSTEIVVDCRNRVEKYGSGDVAECTSRMLEVDARLGLIVAVAGITRGGDANAEEALRAAWLQHQLIIGVIDGEGLQALCRPESPADWLTLVHESIVTARQGRRYRS